MNTLLLTLFFLQTGPSPQQPPANEQMRKSEANLIAQMGDHSKSVMIVDPKARAADYQAAFDLLKREKAASKVVFELSDGQKIANVIDMKMMPNNTLVIFRYSTAQGIQFQAVEIEDIVGIMHQ